MPKGEKLVKKTPEEHIMSDARDMRKSVCGGKDIRCTFDKPTIQNCINCPYPDCIRSDTADTNERIARWRKKNPEKVKVMRRRYYIKHCETEKAYQQSYRAANIEEIRRKDRARKRAERQAG